MEDLFADARPIAVLIATKAEFEAFLKVAYAKANVVMEVKKSLIAARNLDYKEVTGTAPFDQIYKMIIGRQQVIAIHTSESIRRATRAIDYAAWCHRAKLIINFGTAGALKSEIETASVCLANRIVQSDFDISGGLTAKECKKLKQPYIAPGQQPSYTSPYISTDERLRAWIKTHVPEIKEVAVASGNKFVFGQDKIDILEKYDADVVDMEAIGILLTANEEHIPTIILKTISDRIDDQATKYYRNAATASEAGSNLVVDLIAKM